MKKLLLTIACCLGLIANVHAGSVGTTKIFTGNNGGVVTVQKRASSQTDEEGRRSSGLVTLSDVRMNILRTAADNSDEDEPPVIDNAEPAIDTELAEVADEPTDADRVHRTRISGRVRFNSNHIADSSKKLTLNGSFRTLPPEHRTLKLMDVMAVVIGEELVLSGIVTVNDIEYEINSAPESIQRFVRRLIWLIRRS